MITRRKALCGPILALIAATAGHPLRAQAQQALERFGGGLPEDGGDTLEFVIPQLAEDGAVVPVELAAEGATDLLLIAPANPEPEIVHMRFGPLAPRARLVTRIRLAESQEVLAYARLADGRLLEARASVAVLAGGCVG